ncbi:hypothetical protein [Paenimyroides aestuarii]|uniref:Uncharacterized protein n=1 Tax=Paenimyroides aestuarii TaxID=2968490 RepID=A0ABY5NUT4_9FLAO|nr:hypothetical protein [Paenimyroides aestuarii]UUV22329.1 hypothetical protein NPX36_04640 [Paenimyroides aestuarii]
MIALLYITLFSGILPATVLIIKKTKGTFVFTNAIVPFAVLTAFASLYEFLFSLVLKIDTTYWFQAYALLEMGCIVYFFTKVFKGRYKILSLVMLFLFIGFYLISFKIAHENGKLVANALNKTIVTFYTVTFTLLWLTQFIKSDKKIPLKTNPIFYFVSGFVIYYCTTLLLFLASNYLYTNNIFFYEYWVINIIATFVLRILLTVGICKIQQK